MKQYYDGAADAMHAPFEPKTPCRNFETRPCVQLTVDGRKQFRTSECTAHHCARGYQEHYEKGQIPHEFVLDADEDNGLKYFELGEYHGGPKCVRCGGMFCRNCEPGVLTEPCSNQDSTLF